MNTLWSIIKVTPGVKINDSYVNSCDFIYKDLSDAELVELREKYNFALSLKDDMDSYYEHNDSIGCPPYTIVEKLENTIIIPSITFEIFAK